MNAYQEIFIAGNRENEWDIEDVESISQIAAITTNGIIPFAKDIKKRMELMERFSQMFLKGVE